MVYYAREVNKNIVEHITNKEISLNHTYLINNDNAKLLLSDIEDWPKINVHLLFKFLIINFFKTNRTEMLLFFLIQKLQIAG
ncbi:hypothetical protein DCO56_01755 [Sphingobacterium athyrii]|uniref:Uncharacterized protein n=1 Tax=Sphingobacterium athyrii TaxID=2152717 RepID=A0A363NYI7_9SPHI|nr:hypothetical protein DCO56_01755 [Sphingobacterium athyrii]